MSKAGRKSGHCLCGEVRFTAIPKDHDVGACHCRTCQVQASGPFMALDCADTLEFEGDSTLGVFNSSDWAERLFCQNCGTLIAWRLKDRTINIVNVAAFEGLGDVRLDHEVYIDQKPGYYSFAEKTQQLTQEDVLKLFAGGDGE